MADEAVLIYETAPPIPFTCDDSVGIEKGAILMLTDPMTVATATGDTDIVAGIAAEEKIANDGKTKIAVYDEGYFKETAGLAGVKVGLNIITDVGTGSANELVVADGAAEQLVGRSMETATDRQTFMFKLDPRNFDIA